MAGFTLDFNDTFEGYDEIENGTYEVTLEEAKEDVTKNGKEHIAINLRIREDIDQKCRRQMIFVKLWKKKDTGKYNPRQFNTIGKALQVQSGKQYHSLEELLKDFEGRHCRVTVKHRIYNDYDNLDVQKWEPTQFPKARQAAPQPQQTNNDGYRELGNEVDIPF